MRPIQPRDLVLPPSKDEREAEAKPGTQSVHLAVIRDRRELEALKGRWQQLVWSSADATAFAAPAGVLTWYRFVEQHSRIYVLTAWRDGDLVGLAAFSLTRLGPFRLLTTAGAGYGYFGDPLLGSNPNQVADAMADHLHRMVSAGTVAAYLRRLKSDGPMVNALSRRHDLACHRMGPDEASSVVRFDDMLDPDQYFKRVARKHAIARRSRRLAERFDHIEYVVDDPEPDVALDTMRDMLRRRFETDLRIFSTPQNRALTLALVREFVSAGHGRVSSILADGKRIAVTVTLHVGHRAFWNAVAYEPELASFSLGHLELYDYLRNAYAAGIAEVNLGSAGFAYKQTWANSISHHRTIAITAPGLRGKTADALRRAAIWYHRSRLNRIDTIGPPVV